MKTETKRITFSGTQFKASEQEGILEAIVSVFGNVDSYGERVMPGAFKESLAKKLPKGVWMHDWSDVVAKTLEAEELMPGDPRLPAELRELGGLYVKAQFFKDIEDSWQAFLKIARGMVDEFSIGYRLQEWAKDEQDGTIKLLKLDLFEWSPVLVGANRATATLSVKQDLMDGPVGMSIEEHTNLLIERIEKRYEAREAEGSITDGFINRLRETGEKILAIAEKAKARDAKADEAPAIKPADLIEFEQIGHQARLRALRG